jgi:hypothetical protein
VQYLDDDTHMAVPGRGGYSEGDQRGPRGGGEMEGVRLVQMSVAYGWDAGQEGRGESLMQDRSRSNSVFTR